jgi:hypothetical protein
MKTHVNSKRELNLHFMGALHAKNLRRLKKTPQSTVFQRKNAWKFYGCGSLRAAPAATANLGTLDFPPSTCQNKRRREIIRAADSQVVLYVFDRVN